MEKNIILIVLKYIGYFVVSVALSYCMIAIAYALPGFMEIIRINGLGIIISKKQLYNIFRVLLALNVSTIFMETYKVFPKIRELFAMELEPLLFICVLREAEYNVLFSMLILAAIIGVCFIIAGRRIYLCMNEKSEKSVFAMFVNDIYLFRRIEYIILLINLIVFFRCSIKL